jgi:MFS family permease
LVDGGRATFNNPMTRFAVVLISVVALTASPFIALVPAVAINAFASKATGTSVLITAQGIGAVAGALALTPLVHRFGRRQVLLADLVGVCLFLAAYGLAPDLWVGAVALLLVGAAYIGVLAGCNTIVQLYAPTALRGRILGIYMMALGILYPIGALAQGAIADVFGIRAVTVGGAAVLFALLVTVLRRRIPANLDGQSVPAPSTHLADIAGTSDVVT